LFASTVPTRASQKKEEEEEEEEKKMDAPT
jgi:hypothetical protein